MKSTSFSYLSQIFEQTENAPMGSSLNSVIINAFMVFFKKEELEKAILKQKVGFRYVDGIFIIWLHGNA